MQLLADRVLVEFIEESDYTYSGLIIIPKEAKPMASTGWVKEVGPLQMQVQPGDKIVFSRHAGIPIRKPGGVTQAVLDNNEILAVFEDDNIVERQRKTIAISGDTLAQACGLTYDEALLSDVIYVHYNASIDTAYVTFEQVKTVVA